MLNFSEIKSDQKILDVALNTPIDVEFALQSFDENHKLYYSMLQRFQDEILDRMMHEFANALNQKDLKQIDNILTPLMSDFEQMGAGRVHYICHSIQKAVTDQKNQRIC